MKLQTLFILLIMWGSIEAQSKGEDIEVVGDFQLFALSKQVWKTCVQGTEACEAARPGAKPLANYFKGDRTSTNCQGTCLQIEKPKSCPTAGQVFECYKDKKYIAMGNWDQVEDSTGCGKTPANRWLQYPTDWTANPDGQLLCALSLGIKCGGHTCGTGFATDSSKKDTTCATPGACTDQECCEVHTAQYQVLVRGECCPTGCDITTEKECRRAREFKIDEIRARKCRDYPGADVAKECNLSVPANVNSAFWDVGNSASFPPGCSHKGSQDHLILNPNKKTCGMDTYKYAGTMAAICFAGTAQCPWQTGTRALVKKCSSHTCGTGFATDSSKSDTACPASGCTDQACCMNVACKDDEYNAIKGKPCTCGGADCAVGNYCFGGSCKVDGKCKSDAYYAVSKECLCAAETDPCRNGQFCYSNGCKSSAGCTVRAGIQTEFFFGAKFAGSWNSDKREMTLELPVPGDITVKKIEWYKAQDQTLLYDPTDKSTKWKIDSSSLCEPKYKLTVTQAQFFGKGSRFSLTGKQMKTNLKITTEEPVNMIIDGYKYTHKRQMQNKVPIIVNLETATVVRAHFNTVFSTQKTIQLNYQFSLITDVTKFLKECNAMVKKYGITCASVKAATSRRIRRILLIGNAVITFSGSVPDVSKAIAAIKVSGYKTTSFGPFTVVVKVVDHHDFVFLLAAKEIMDKNTIEIKMEVHSRTGIDHTKQKKDKGVKVTDAGKLKIDESVVTTPFKWDEDAAGVVKYEKEHNLFVETVTWTFSPKGYESASYDIPLEFNLKNDLGVFVSFAKVNVKQADVLGDIGFTVSKGLYADAACTTTATQFALGSKFYLKITVSDNPVDAKEIKCDNMILSQTKTGESTPTETDLKKKDENDPTKFKYKFTETQLQTNVVVCGAQLLGTGFHAKHDGYQTDLKVDLVVEYKQGEQTDIRRRQLMISSDISEESVADFANQYRAPDRKSVGIEMTIVDAPESSVGVTGFETFSDISNRNMIMYSSIGIFGMIAGVYMKSLGQKKEEELSYLLANLEEDFE